MWEPDYRETIINFNARCDTASVYTAQRNVWELLEKWGFEATDVHISKKEGITGKEFELPKKLCIPRKPRKYRPLTEAQKQALAKGRKPRKTSQVVG